MVNEISNPLSPHIRSAAQYLRMSTEEQHYSISNQAVAIAQYAASQNIRVVRSFIDEGKSGLTIRGRSGLRDLLEMVKSGFADFELILVYDISRWGRFPDVDESAHYEYLCASAGVPVEYCSEQFANDNSTISNLMKALKRAMAAEFSRELAAKVRAGKHRLALAGFWVGGEAPYGFSRYLIDQSGNGRQILYPGDCKGHQSHRTILVPGNAREIEMVRRVFDLCVSENKTNGEIAKLLNAEGLAFREHPWDPSRINRIVKNPLYAGTNVLNRRPTTTKKDQIVCEGVFASLVSPQQFEAARKINQKRKERFTRRGMLDRLRDLWNEHGTLSKAIIDQATGVCRSTLYSRRFGGLVHAYRLIGFKPKKDYSFVKTGHKLNAKRESILLKISKQLSASGGYITFGAYGKFRINDEITARIMLCRPRRWPCGQTIWPMALMHERPVDIIIAARLEPKHPFEIVDYFLIPKGAQLRGIFHTRRRNIARFLDLYRTKDLMPIIELFKRTQIFELEAP